VPRGPFSQAVEAEGRFLFISGQGPFDPASGDFVRGDIARQTRLTLDCIDRVLQKAGARRDQIVSCRVYLQPLDTQTFAAMNEVYAEFFGGHRPARATVGTQLLNIDVEIECVALLE
jgi:2-iminobutanoate/2-iminopropanoate deaminase